MQRRIVGPLRDRLTQEGYTQPALRAEVLAAAFIGVILGRHAGTFKHLAKAPADQLVDVLADILGSTLQDAIDYLVDEIVRQGLSHVALVGHSWAGYPITAAAHRSGKDVVSHVIYYAAIVPAPGKGSIDECLPEHAAYFREAIDATPDNSVTIGLDLVQQSLANGTDESLQRLLSELLVPQPGRYLTDSLRLPPLRTIGIAADYLKCEDDRAVPPDQNFAARLGVKALTVPGCHESLLTHPDELADALLRAASSVGREDR